jgi:hypothetical protein
LAILAKCWDGADESTDSMLPTTGLVGGCGIGLSLLTDAIVKVSPASALEVSAGCYPVIASEAKQSRSNKQGLDCFVAYAPRNDG